MDILDAVIRDQEVLFPSHKNNILILMVIGQRVVMLMMWARRPIRVVVLIRILIIRAVEH